ncbi:MAG: hypothetical protein MUC43_00005 [Pirellula sp.]|nr:hypothetical protein [Pirellula sp.]
MADDLDDFLRQAAERRKQRQKQKENRGPIAAEPLAAPPLSESETQSRKQPLSQQQTVAQSRQRQSEHVVIAEAVETSRLKSQFDPPAKPTKQQKKQKSQQQQLPSSQTRVLANTSDVPARETGPELPTKILNSSNIIQNIRDPQSLRTAIIVHEILKRPWQD